MDASLTVYYRLTPRANAKGRPAWFSKRVALQSLLASLAQSGGDHDLVFVSDGGVPSDLADLVQATGEVVEIQGGSAAASLRRLLDLVWQRHTGGGPGLLWFAEDDYIYRPEAFARLRAAEAALPDAAYFTLYTPDNASWHAEHPSQPAVRGPEHEVVVGDTTWRRTYDTNSTFGMRTSAVARDARLHRASTYAGAPFDHVALLLTSGLQPFPWRHLLRDLYVRPHPRALAGAVGRPLSRTLLNVLHLTLARDGRAWYAPAEDQATHVEQGHLSVDWDWQSYAHRLGDGDPLGPGPSGESVRPRPRSGRSPIGTSQVSVSPTPAPVLAECRGEADE